MFLFRYNNYITFLWEKDMSKYSTGDEQLAGNKIIEGDLVTNGRIVDVVAVNAAYTVSTGDEVVLVTTGGAAKIITLPTPVGNKGRVFTIKKVDAAAFAATVTPAAGLIDGAANFSVSAQYKYVTAVSDGTNYLIIANN
jgi:hypothetical protein